MAKPPKRTSATATVVHSYLHSVRKNRPFRWEQPMDSSRSPARLYERKSIHGSITDLPVDGHTNG
jgi:hypothetical protein